MHSKLIASGPKPGPDSPGDVRLGQTLRRSEDKRIEAFEMWIWRRMERVKWTDRIRNESMLERMAEERMMLKLVRKRKRNLLGHWLRRNCLLKDALEGIKIRSDAGNRTRDPQFYALGALTTGLRRGSIPSTGHKGKIPKEKDSIRCWGLSFGVAQWLERLFLGENKMQQVAKLQSKSLDRILESGSRSAELNIVALVILTTLKKMYLKLRATDKLLQMLQRLETLDSRQGASRGGVKLTRKASETRLAAPMEELASSYTPCLWFRSGSTRGGIEDYVGLDTFYGVMKTLFYEKLSTILQDVRDLLVDLVSVGRTKYMIIFVQWEDDKKDAENRDEWRYIVNEAKNLLGFEMP
ncbi:hypothetical protein ANN_03718 [Periplaneta americana]|uniref:Uncharacterized protein n=1 Tax=Periplaneta americana TaxID=6978 RepID=A0ABQ8TZT5_PERAM|nr:hypothetical protein ANN_03718 [Periplaneta americana]